MRSDEFDPAYRSALREAMVIAAVFLAALTYTIIYCWVFGYGRDPASVVLYLGIPDWVFWGVFAPWTACFAVTVWYCFFFMADDNLDPVEGDTPPLVPDVDEGTGHAS